MHALKKGNRHGRSVSQNISSLSRRLAKMICNKHCIMMKLRRKTYYLSLNNNNSLNNSNSLNNNPSLNSSNNLSLNNNLNNRRLEQR